MPSNASLPWAPSLLLVICASACGLSEIPRAPGGATAPAPAVGEPAPDAGAGPRDGAAAPAAPGVTIAGQWLPRDRVLVFLHVGHSNMAGRATSPAELRGFNYDTHPQLWAYAAGGSWKPAREPLSPDSMTQGRAGPGMSILRAALAAAPGHHVVSIGHGHSGQTGGYCRNFRRAGVFYQLTMGPARELRGKVTFAAVFTMFGTSEVNDRGNAARFGDCMAGMAAEMREDLGEPELPFVIGDWEEEAMTSLTPDSEMGRLIIPQLRALPMRIPRAVVTPTAGLPIIPDDHHYDFTGYKLWAERGVAALRSAGLAPWAR